MTEILTDLTPASLASANRANLLGYFRRLEESPAFDVEHQDGITRWRCPHPYYWFNSVICNRDAKPGDDALLDETLAFYRARNVGSIGWWLEEGVSSEGWESLLFERGFQVSKDPPGMGADLAKLPEKQDLLDGLEIKRITEIEDLVPFAHLTNSVFGFPPEAERATFDCLVGMGLEMPALSYLAHLDGKPVGTSAILYHAGVAGIYNVAVHPDARGKGIGAMLTLLPLLEARDLGYKAGILQSSGMGYPVYRRLGFEKNCDTIHYYYTMDRD
jgi:GNAT superfamily N-acetyltransferase